MCRSIKLELIYLDYNAAQLATDQRIILTGNLKFGALRLHERKLRIAKDDLESAYYSLLALAKIELPWQNATFEKGAYYKRRIAEVRVSNSF